jgi:hopanoid biosynthesis associated protein HpnK
MASPKPTVRLIVNADDFGRSHEINLAIAQAHDSGIVTSASLMVTGGATEEAVALARARTRLAVGLHVVVLGGRAVLPPDVIPHLVDGEGRFRRRALTAGVRYFFIGAAREELAREMRAQFEAFKATGLPLSHVDGHHHMHLHPTVLALLLPLAQEFGARGLRVNVADELFFSLRGDPTRPGLKLGWKLAFVLLAANGRRLLRNRSLPTAGRVYGLMQTGRVTEAYLLRLLERMADKQARSSRDDGRHEDRVVEIFCHPSLRHESRRLGPNPDDLAAMVSPAVAEGLTRHGIELTTYPAAFPVGAGSSPA